MAGNITGGKLAAATNKAKYGENFYREIGALGGKKGTTGGFWADRELARIAGAKGGRISKIGYRYVDGQYIKKEEPTA